MKKVLVLGGGITGLSTAWKVSEDTNLSVEVLELRNTLGGISTTFKHKEYLLDYGPHKIATQIPEVLNIIKDLIGDDLLVIPKKSKIRLIGKYFNYPLGLKNVILEMNPLIGLKCGLSSGKTMISNMIKKKKDITYTDYVTNRFGKGIYKLIFEPYAKKVWGNPEKLSFELARTRIAIPSMFTMLKNLLFGNKNKPQISVDQFYYPKKGIIMLTEALVKKIKSKEGIIQKEANPKVINLLNDRVDNVIYEKNGKKVQTKADMLISTIPIEKLILLIQPPPPQNIIEAASNLRYRSLILFYVVVGKPRLFNDNWIFFPEDEFIFNRLSEQKGFSESMIPEDKTVLTVEITCETNNEIYNASKEDLFKKVITDLEKAGILKKSDVLDFFIVKLKNIYPVYDLDFKKNMDIILEYLKSIKNLYTNGRQGLFNYNNIDHCMDMGFILAEHISVNGTKNDWEQKNKRFNEYKIVD